MNRDNIPTELILRPQPQPHASPPQLLLKPDQAAKALAISPRLLWGLTHAGDLPCVRIGRSVRYDPRDLLAWIDRRKQE